jgi:release factor glutamine methyltransferase
MSSAASSSLPNSATRRTLCDWGAAALDRAGREEPHRTATWLLVDVLECRRIDLHLDPDVPVDPEARDTFAEMICRRAEGEPLQHILGYDEFYGLRLRVTPDVLIPRPETEEVVEHALDLLESTDAPRILDAGTGSGCIALALAAERPDAEVAAFDVSEDALAVARDNADRLGLAVTWFQADLLDEDVVGRVEEQGAGGVDLLVSNPPYIPDEEADGLPEVVRDYDPPVALFAGDDPLRFYRRLATVGRSLCRPGGWIVVETHATYAEGVAGVFREAGWQEVSVARDLAGRPRIATGRRGLDDAEDPRFPEG